MYPRIFACCSRWLFSSRIVCRKFFQEKFSTCCRLPSHPLHTINALGRAKNEVISSLHWKKALIGIKMERESVVPCVRLVRAVYDYVGENNDELCLKKGDIITVTQTPEGGWFEGTLRGMTGWFPCNYIEPIFDEDQNNVTTNSKTSDHKEKTSTGERGENTTDTSVTGTIDKINLSRDENEEYRKQVIREIMESEATYIKELTLIHQNILMPFIKSGITALNETTAVVNSIIDILNVHIRFLGSLRSLLESRPSRTLRVGGVFMEYAATIKDVHTKYCALHPHFVSSIEKYKGDIINYFKSINIENGSLVLTSSLSFSFRRLDRYPALLQQLQKYTGEDDADRGDTQRAGYLYRELVACCLEVRRQKEMELEVMLGNIKNWPSNLPSVETFGPIIRMNLVNVTPPSSVTSKDRYLVLFEDHLLILSVSREMTSFYFEICWPLNDILPLPRNDSQSNQLEFMVKRSSGSSSSVDDESDKRNDQGKWIVSYPNVELACDWFTVITENLFKLNPVDRSPTSDHLNQRLKVTSGSSSTSSTTGSKGITSQSIATSLANLPSVSSNSETVMSHHLDLTGYWINHAILPHAPLQLKDVKKSAKDPSGSVRASSPADDMAILATIESYCSGGGKRKPLINGDKNKSESTDAHQADSRNASDASDEFKNAKVEDLVIQIKQLRGEVKQLRSDLDFVLNQFKLHPPTVSK